MSQHTSTTIKQHMLPAALRAFALTMTVMTTGCNGNEDIYHLNTGNKQDITDVHVEQLEKVNLETNSNTLLYTINDITPFRSGYLIMGREKLLHFDSNGNYICQIGRKGRGPGEYLNLSSYYVHNDTVCIYCNNNHNIIKYTIESNECEYAGHTAIPDTLSISNLIQNRMYPDRYFSFNTYHGIGGIVPCVSIYDRNFRPIATSTARIKDGGFGWPAPFGSNESGILFTDYMSYTVTELDDKKIDESRKLDFGTDNIPQKYLEYTDVMEAIHYLQDSSYIDRQLPTRMFKYGETLYIGLRNGLIGTYGLRDRTSRIFRIVDREGAPMLYTTFSVHNGNIYIASAGSDNDIDNPPFYIIPVESLTKPLRKKL